MNIASRFVTLSELTVELAASRSAVRRWLEDGDVTAYAFGSGRNAELRYEREDVDEWIARSGGSGEGEDGDEDGDEAELDGGDEVDADDEEDGLDDAGEDAGDDADDASDFDLDSDEDEGDDDLETDDVE